MVNKGRLALLLHIDADRIDISHDKLTVSIQGATPHEVGRVNLWLMLNTSPIHNWACISTP